MTIRSDAAGIHRKFGHFLWRKKKKLLVFTNEEFSHQFSKIRLKNPRHFLKAKIVRYSVLVASMGHCMCHLLRTPQLFSPESEAVALHCYSSFLFHQWPGPLSN